MNRFPACLGASLEKEPRCGFEEWFSALKSGVCSPPQLGEEWSEMCLESRAPPPHNVGSPLLEVTVPACSALMDCAGVQIREVGWRPRNNLASADTKPGPSDPAGLHGGCTESGLISGTRPNELITGLSFPALPATFSSSAGGGVPCICLQSCAEPGAGEGWGGGHRVPTQATIGVGLSRSRAYLSPEFFAWGPPCLR